MATFMRAMMRLTSSTARSAAASSDRQSITLAAERCEHPLRTALAVGRELSTCARVVVHLEMDARTEADAQSRNVVAEIVGRTPVRPFDPSAADPFLLRPGDRVRFVPENRDAIVDR